MVIMLLFIMRRETLTLKKVDLENCIVCLFKYRYNKNVDIDFIVIIEFKIKKEFVTIIL